MSIVADSSDFYLTKARYSRQPQRLTRLLSVSGMQVAIHDLKSEIVVTPTSTHFCGLSLLTATSGGRLSRARLRGHRTLAPLRRLPADTILYSHVPRISGMPSSTSLDK